SKDLLVNEPYIDEIVVYSKKTSFFKKIRSLLQERKKNYDLVIDLVYDYILETSIITFFIGKKYRLGFSFGGRDVFYNLSVNIVHTAESFIELNNKLLEVLGVKNFVNDLKLTVNKEEELNIRKYFIEIGVKAKQNIFVIHPGGYYKTQQWAKDKFVELILQLVKIYDAKIFLIGNMKEVGIIDYIYRKIVSVNSSNKDHVFKIIDFPLSRLIALINNSTIFIGNNSGPLHIACALRKPTISTMGPTNPYLWWPVGKDNIVLRRQLPCSPCKRKNCSSHSCLEDIKIEEFINSINVLMEKLRLNSKEEKVNEM
ncbi:MAG: glycosyltransferase family 9 protein, partial [Endomicrobiia bacterium]